MTLGRNGTVDILRFVAAAAVTWYHAGAAFPGVAHAALPLLAIYFAYYAVVVGDQPGGARRRAAGLFRLWIVWSVVFAALKIVEALVFGDGVFSWLEGWMLFTGTSVHLWLLPVAIALMGIGYGLARFVAGSASARWIVVAAAVVTALPALWLIHLASLKVPLEQWVSIWPAAAAGFAFAVLPAAMRLAGGIVIVAFISALAWVFGWTQGVVEFASVSILALLTVVIATPSTRLSSLAGDLYLNVYAIHAAVLGVLLLVPGVGDMPAILALLAIVVTVAIAWFLSDRDVEFAADATN